MERRLTNLEGRERTATPFGSSIRKIASGQGVEEADADGKVKIARIFHSLATLDSSA